MGVSGFVLFTSLIRSFPLLSFCYPTFLLELCLCIYLVSVNLPLAHSVLIYGEFSTAGFLLLPLYWLYCLKLQWSCLTLGCLSAATQNSSFLGMGLFWRKAFNFLFFHCSFGGNLLIILPPAGSCKCLILSWQGQSEYMEIQSFQGVCGFSML